MFAQLCEVAPLLSQTLELVGANRAAWSLLAVSVVTQPHIKALSR